MNASHPDIVVRHIKTKNKIRKITTYRSDNCDLRIRHEKINDFIKSRFIPSTFSKGYVKGQSIYSNACAHMYNDYFIMTDIKDFFPHICHTQLSEKLYHELNVLSENQISRKECYQLVEDCSISSRGLPLGFITSPILSNVYLKEFDCIFYGKLKQLDLENVIYTRYADDIIVFFKCKSANKPLPIESCILETAASLLHRYGLQLNKSKTRSYNLYVSNHVRVTGINITKSKSGYRHLTVGRSIKNALYWDALNCYETKDKSEADRIKGLQSFVLSVEKNGYEGCYSTAMMRKVQDLGFGSVKELIDSL